MLPQGPHQLAQKTTTAGRPREPASRLVSVIGRDRRVLMGKLGCWPDRLSRSGWMPTRRSLEPQAPPPPIASTRAVAAPSASSVTISGRRTGGGALSASGRARSPAPGPSTGTGTNSPCEPTRHCIHALISKVGFLSASHTKLSADDTPPRRFRRQKTLQTFTCNASCREICQLAARTSGCFTPRGRGAGDPLQPAAAGANRHSL